MTNDTEDRPMTADIIAFGTPRAPTQEPAMAQTPQASRQGPDYASMAKRAAVATLLGAVKTVAFSAYVLLFWTRGIVRLVLGLVGGLSLLMLIVAFFMPHDFEPREKALVAFGVAGVGATILRILFDRLIYQLAPEGTQA